MLKGIHNQINEADRIIMFYGRFLSWYDPMTLLKAFKRVIKKTSKIKLVFLGAAGEKGTEGKGLWGKIWNEIKDFKDQVIFLDWVKYNEIGNYLLEADIGVITHLNTPESKYSLRIRALDFIKARIPLVVSDGGFVAELIKEQGGGLVVSPEDPDALARAIIRLINDKGKYEEAKNSLAKIAKKLEWQEILKPLEKLCGEGNIKAPRRPGILRMIRYYFIATPLELLYYLFKFFESIFLRINLINV